MHNRIRTIGITTIVFALFLAGIWPQPAFANMGPPTSGGGYFVAEPNGLETVEIIHETLTIDLRPFLTNDFVHVEAIYEIENHAAACQIDLVFPTAAAAVNGVSSLAK